MEPPRPELPEAGAGTAWLTAVGASLVLAGVAVVRLARPRRPATVRLRR